MQNKNKKLIRMKGEAAGEFSAESTREYRLALCVWRLDRQLYLWPGGEEQPCLGNRKRVISE